MYFDLTPLTTFCHKMPLLEVCIINHQFILFLLNIAVYTASNIVYTYPVQWYPADILHGCALHAYLSYTSENRLPDCTRYHTQ